MGIKSLNRFLCEKCSDNSINKINLKDLSNKKVVIDTSIYLYKFTSEGVLMENMYLFISILLHYKIIPLFVFDGKPPREKRDLLKQRRLDKASAEEKYIKLKSEMEDLSNNKMNKNIENEMKKLKRMFIRINDEEIKKVKLETLIKELELKTIKSQINPHFIFNALNSIRALVDEDPNRARQAITELSNILRSSVQTDKVEITSFEKELAIVKDYLALEYIRFADRLKIIYEIEPESLQFQFPPMMLQTLVENAIKHGLSKHPGDCIIKIVAKAGPQKQTIEVINSGILQFADHDGFGLQSTKERLKILYGGDALFDIYQLSSNQVAAKLEIPYPSALNKN